MKRLLFILVFAAPAAAQFVVHDPVNTAVNAAVQAGQVAHHLEILHRWAAQLEGLNRQIRELEQQLAVQRRIRDVMGDPVAAGAELVLHGFGADELLRQYGETLQAVRRLSDAVGSLRRTADGIYARLDDRTVLGHGFERQESYYRRYAAVERQADNLARVHEETAGRVASLQSDLAGAVARLRAARTQAEVDKLNGTIAVLNGQLAQMDARRRDEADKLNAQQILNENQAAKERQDLHERQLAEERQTFAAVNAWQESLKLTPSRYTQP